MLSAFKTFLFYGHAPTLDDYIHRQKHPNRSEGGYRLRGGKPAGYLNGRPLISLITVVRNAERTLAGTIQSVLGQTYQPIEYIIIDGASADGTLDIIRAHESGITYWLSEPDHGIYDAFNKGVAASTGQFIGYLNADDWLSPDQIEYAVDALLASGADFVFGDTWLHGWKGQDILMKGDPNYGLVIRKTMPALFQTTMLYSIGVMKKVGLFRTNFRTAGDYDWLIRVHLAGLKGYYEPRIVGHMLAGGISTARQRLSIYESFVACIKNSCSLLPSTFYWGYRFTFPNGDPNWFARRVARLEEFKQSGLRSISRTRHLLSSLLWSPRQALRDTLIKFADRSGLLPRLMPYRHFLNRIFGEPPEVEHGLETERQVTGPSGQPMMRQNWRTSNKNIIHSKLRKNEPLRVVFLNDIGFIGGAGIALRRQVQSFLLNGHTVGIVCWWENKDASKPNVHGADPKGEWLGLHSLPSAHSRHGLNADEIASMVTQKVMELSPDVVITGNLHWAQWPATILAKLRDNGVFVVAYLHDCHWITGRCAYLGNCKLYLTGCDETCPTADIYPPLAPERIADAWKLRREVFTGPNAIPCATNSRWMKDIADQGFHGRATVEVVWLGLDHRLFAPADQRLTRCSLNLTDDGLFILSGAVDIKEPRKGGLVLLDVLRQLAQKPGVKVIAFGYQSDRLEGVDGLGAINDERRMPLVFSAADIFINASTEEAFGQTMMEASACGVPIVAVNAGGVSDIARHGQNALLVSEASPKALLEAVEVFLADAQKRKQFGQTGRNIVEQEFTLEAQYQRWHSYLLRVTAKHDRPYRMLNLGCGNRYHSDWINVDFRSNFPGVIACDLKRGLPFLDNSFDIVYHSHLLEHFSKRYAPVFLKECFRVLKPGGILRTVVPDLEQIARHYLSLLEQSLQGNEEAQKRYAWIMLEMFDQMVRNHSGGEMFTYWEQDPMPAEDFVIQRVGSEVLNALKWLRNPSNRAQAKDMNREEQDAKLIGEFRLSGEIHQWMYDQYSLRILLQWSGFRDIKICRADESEIPNFNHYLLDIEADGSVRKPESLFMEAKKQGTVSS